MLKWDPMPWCPTCDRFLSPSTVTPVGACPRCGRMVDPGHARANVGATEPRASGGLDPASANTTDDSDDDTLPLPWHFKLLVGAIALYLGWRGFQGVEWIAGRL